MKRQFSFIATALTITALSACAHFSTVQSDVTTKSGDRTVTTTVTGYTLFSSTQLVEKLKATTTEKSQSVGTDSLAQQGATNTAATLEAIAHILQAAYGK